MEVKIIECLGEKINMEEVDLNNSNKNEERYHEQEGIDCAQQ